MEIVDMKDVLKDVKKYASLLQEGAIFVYPTDTVYGIGGNAELKEVCEKVYEIKRRPKNKPLSVIAPSFEWITKHFDISKSILRLYFPGPYTLILRKKDKEFLKFASQGEYLGVRIPDHEITLLVSKANVPLITTSANLSGNLPAARLEEVDKEVLEQAHIAIKGKCHLGKPSTVINPYTNEVLR